MYVGPIWYRYVTTHRRPMTPRRTGTATRLEGAAERVGMAVRFDERVERPHVGRHASTWRKAEQIALWQRPY